MPNFPLWLAPPQASRPQVTAENTDGSSYMKADEDLVKRAAVYDLRCHAKRMNQYNGTE